VFGILANISMEFMKPPIAKRLLRKAVAVQLGSEVRDISDDLERATKLVLDLRTDGKPLDEFKSRIIQHMIGNTHWERYEFYLETERRVVYELDPEDSFGQLREWIAEDISDCIRAGDLDVLECFFEDCAAIVENLKGQLKSRTAVLAA
jgi:hypothetical protein